jgi:hypothetical protein
LACMFAVDILAMLNYSWGYIHIACAGVTSHRQIKIALTVL